VLPGSRHRCKLEVRALTRSRGDGTVRSGQSEAMTQFISNKKHLTRHSPTWSGSPLRVDRMTTNLPVIRKERHSSILVTNDLTDNFYKNMQRLQLKEWMFGLLPIVIVRLAGQ